MIVSLWCPKHGMVPFKVTSTCKLICLTCYPEACPEHVTFKSKRVSRIRPAM